MKIKSIKMIILWLLVLGILILGFMFYVIKKKEYNFEKIEIGSDQSEVIRTLGKPDLVLSKGEQATAYQKTFMDKNPNIIEGYFYLSPTKYMPQFFAIGFDGNHKVNDKANYISY